MFVLISIFVLFLSFVIWVIMSWMLYIDATKKYTKRYGYGTYKKFIINFKKNELKYDEDVIGFLNICNNSMVSSFVIEFKGIGMLLNPIDWVRANIYINKINKKRMYKW